MRTAGFIVSVCLAIGALTTAPTTALTTAQSTAPDADKVLAAAREALGGEKKLAAVKTLTATGRTRQVRGDSLVPIEFEIAMELPDKYMRRDEVPAQESGPTTVGINGDELLQFPVPTTPTMPARAGGPPAPTPEQTSAMATAARTARLAGVRQDFARLTLGMFGASYGNYPLTFTYAGKAEAPQGKADVLDVKGPGGFAARLFINAETHLPIMLTWQPPAAPQRGMRPDGPGAAPPSGATARGPAPAPPPESRIYYADYREVNGLQLPFRLRRAVGPDTVEETTFDGFKINVKIDPRKFEARK
jgi:hypothetical protein